MIRKISGVLQEVGDGWVAVGIGTIDYEVMVPGFVHRELRHRQGESVSLYTLHYLDGNPVQGRMVPRLIGFRNDSERAFFELFGTVDGMGWRKALRALEQPIRDIARAIQDSDIAFLTSMPGVGEAIAERIVAKLRRKVARYALIPDDEKTATGQAGSAARRDAVSALVGIGHRQREAEQMVQTVLTDGKTFATVEELLAEVYRQHAAR